MMEFPAEENAPLLYFKVMELDKKAVLLSLSLPEYANRNR